MRWRGIHAHEAGEVVDDEVIHRPALALLTDDHALESPTASRALTLGTGAVTGEHVRDRLPRSSRGDPKSIPGPRRHGRVGSDDPDRGRLVAANELAAAEAVRRADTATCPAGAG